MKSLSSFFIYIILPLATFNCLTLPHLATAQSIIPDATLGAENSVVNPFNTNIDVIDGGARRGANLFHSFQQFDIGTGRSAYFNNPSGVNNIFSRITGNNPSSIDGTLGVVDLGAGVLGNANLFLINPRGIIFGANAKLNIGGSFLATTADSVIFDNGFDFSVSNPTAPPLLTVNFPTGLRFRDNPGSITNQSQVPDINNYFSGLQVKASKFITLAGGNVDINRGYVTAPGGSINIGALTSAGVVGLNNDGSLNFPNGGTGNIQLNGGNIRTVDYNNIIPTTGNISLDAGGNIDLFNSSNIWTIGNVGGNINIVGGNRVFISDSNVLAWGYNDTEDRFSTINISAPNGTVWINSSSVSATNFGTKFAGDIFIDAADEVSITDSASTNPNDPFDKGISSQGNSGRIFIGRNIQPKLVDISGSTLETSNKTIRDSGIDPQTAINAGGISIEASELINLRDFTRIGALSQRLGNSGGIFLQSNSLIALRNNTVLDISSFGSGDGGAIALLGGNISIDNSILASSAYVSSANPRVSGNAGAIALAGNIIGIDNNSILTSRSFGSGNAGAIAVAGSSIGIYNSSSLSSSSSASGNAGSIDINANDLIEIGNNSEISSTGNLGKIFIGYDPSDSSLLPQTLNIQSSQITTNNESTGLAGDIYLNASDRITIGSNSEISSTGNLGKIFIGYAESDLSTRPTTIEIDNLRINANSNIGTAGDISINAKDRFSITNSAIGSESTEAANSGNINVFSGNTIAISNTLIANRSFGTGNAGSINLLSNTTIDINSGSVFDSSSFDLGNAGFIKLISSGINIDDSILASSSYVSPESPGISGKAGAIDLLADSIVTNDSILTSRSYGSGDAGSISALALDRLEILKTTIASDASGATNLGGQAGDVTLRGTSIVQATDSFITSENFSGDGGTIGISGGDLQIERTTVAANAYGSGNAGTIIALGSGIQIKDSRIVSNGNGFGVGGRIAISASSTDVNVESSTISTLSNNDDTSNSGQFGLVFIGSTSGSVFLKDSKFESDNLGGAQAGGIALNALNTISLERSRISSNGLEGDIVFGTPIPGSEELSPVPEQIEIKDSTLTTDSDGRAIAGNISVNAKDGIDIANSRISSTGNLGRIFVGADINSLSVVPVKVDISNSEIVTDSNSGTAGDILVFASDRLTAKDNRRISSESSDLANAGNIALIAGNTLNLNNSSIATSAIGSGKAGAISLNAARIDLKADGLGGEISSTGNLGKVFIGYDAGNSPTSPTPDTIEIDNYRIRTDSDNGTAGDIFAKASDRITINNGTISSQSSALADAGSIEIDTKTLQASGGEISTSTSGSGRGGSINLTASNVNLTNGVLLNANTSGTGAGGSISVGSQDRKVETLDITSGSSINAKTSGAGDAGDINLTVRDDLTIRGSRSGVFATTERGSTGDGGSINIDPKVLLIEDGGAISANSNGTGEGGSVSIQADTLFLNNGAIETNATNNRGGDIGIEAGNLVLNGGRITTKTSSGDGGSIDLNVREFLSLSRESEISTTAAGTGDGGNIKINADFIIGFPVPSPTSSNSDITANASQGRGGKIEISSQGVFGLKVRDSLTALNDITAFSQAGTSLNGQILLNTPDADPSQGLVELTEDVTDPNRLISQNPCQRSSGSTFVVTGRGGLSPNPDRTVNNDAVRVDLLEPAPSNDRAIGKDDKPQSKLDTNEKVAETRPSEPVPAQGLVFNEKGEALLTAYNPNGAERKDLVSQYMGCPAR